MGKIENIKAYAGRDLENIFFRPMLTGQSAEELGIKVLYNMPAPTVFHFWRRTGDILQNFTSCGWAGASPSMKYQKTITLNKVKAEMNYSADDYFATVYELITARPEVNMQDLSGTELEEAETALFRQAIAESIRCTMWYGSTSRSNGPFKTFDGLLRRITFDAALTSEIKKFGFVPSGNGWAEGALKRAWDDSTPALKALKPEGNLAFFVSSDLYTAYEDALDNADYESSFIARQNGRQELCYRGIPLVDVQMGNYNTSVVDLPQTFVILTDRRNLAIAVNTADFPGTEVRMWYNPDMMENRQRAVFMAGCDYLLPELISLAVGIHVTEQTNTMTSAGGTLAYDLGPDYSIVNYGSLICYNALDEELDYETELTLAGRNASITLDDAQDIDHYEVTFSTSFGSQCTLKYQL